MSVPTERYNWREDQSWPKPPDKDHNKTEMPGRPKPSTPEQPVKEPVKATEPTPPLAGGPVTEIIGRPKRHEGGFNAYSPAPVAAETDGMADPVVGWLVIVEGPGRGHFVRLGYGWNSIGRGKQYRVCLDYGDLRISGQNEHARVNYEPRERKFVFIHQQGKTTSYVGGKPVYGPTEIAPGDVIQVGDTHLRFVPLCGEDFDWNVE